MDSEAEFNELAKEIHNGEDTIVAEAVVYIAEQGEYAFSTSSILLIRDVEGIERTIYLPIAFIEKIILASHQVLSDDGHLVKKDNDFENFIKAFKTYFRDDVSESDLKEMFANQAICFVASNQEAISGVA